MSFQWSAAAAFSERVSRLDLHGLHFQHVRLCQRRAWMYLHGINFAQWNARVQTGIAEQATRYARDRSTRGLFGLAPDRIDWEQRIVYEHKGSGGAAEPVADQAAFYATMLSIASGHTWTSVVHVMTTKKRRTVTLDQTRLDRLWASSEMLEALAQRYTVPPGPRIDLCTSCSLQRFCGHR